MKAQKYDKRFFKLDIKTLTLSYAKDPALVDTAPAYDTALRNIISVKRNVVSMPHQDADGKITFVEHSIFDTDYDIDRGPTNQVTNVFEIKVIDRIFTLFTEDNILMEKFVLYIEKIIQLKEEIQVRQKQEDELVNLRIMR